MYAAETDEDARRLFTSAQLQVLNLIRGTPRQLPPPVDSMEGHWSPAEQEALAHRTQYTVVGSADTVRTRLEQIYALTKAEEIIAVAQIYEHTARLRSYQIGARIFPQLAGPQVDLPPPL